LEDVREGPKLWGGTPGKSDVGGGCKDALLDGTNFEQLGLRGIREKENLWEG